MSKKRVKVSMELPELPEGFEYTGEFRSVENSEYYLPGYLPGCDNIKQWNRDFPTRWEYPIIRKCKVWRDATVHDIWSAVSGEDVFVWYGGEKMRLVGGTCVPDGPTFLIRTESGSDFWVDQCGVCVS